MPLQADAVPAVRPVQVAVAAVVEDPAVAPEPAREPAADAVQVAVPALDRAPADLEEEPEDPADPVLPEVPVLPAVQPLLQLPVSPIRQSMVPFLERVRRRVLRRRILFRRVPERWQLRSASLSTMDTSMWAILVQSSVTSMPTVTSRLRVNLKS